MGRATRILGIGILCAGGVIALIVAAVLGLRLLANHGAVGSFIAQKTLQATGGALGYDRLEIKFWPRLHLSARNFRLHRPQAFDIRATSLSVYPAIGPLLRGEVRIRRLSLASPDGTVSTSAARRETPPGARASGPDLVSHSIPRAIRTLFSALAVIDPSTEIRIDDGTLTLALTGRPAIHITGIHVNVQRGSDDLAIDLQCRTDTPGELALHATVDMAAGQAAGSISLSDLNLRPLLAAADLPSGISVAETLASAELNVEIDGPEAVHGQFDLHFPDLTVRRLKTQLTFDQAGLSGAFTYDGRGLSVSVDTLKAKQPDIQLSGKAAFNPDPETGRSSMDLHAGAANLDVAVASAIGRVFAGDRQAVRTAFDVVRQGQLSSVVFDAQLTADEAGWQLHQMTAAARLSRGRVTIPGGLANLERLEGDLVYDGQRLAFSNARGHIQGADFSKLNAAIDWTGEATLAIASTAIIVDSAPFFDWLTSLEGLSHFKKTVASIKGRAALSNLTIQGPLTRPHQWAIAATGTPQGVDLAGPSLPFAVRLSGGQINYTQDRQRAQGVAVAFLDGSFRVDYQSQGIAADEPAVWQIDGSMGQATIDWLSTRLPIPEHLKIKPPIQISDARIAWNHATMITFTGGVKTGGGVTLFADLMHTPGTWRIGTLKFSDGHSQVTASADLQETTIQLAFAGNFEKQTADRLFRDNRSLTGRLEGDFRTVIDTRNPVNSSFDGQLSGQGLRIHQLATEPIEVRQFSIDGRGSQLKIVSSEVSLFNSLMKIDGLVDRSAAGLTFDLNLNANRLDDTLIRALLPKAKAKTDQTAPTTDHGQPRAMVVRGEIHLKTTDFTYGSVTWSPVEADIRLGDDRLHVQIDKADLCGISTIGEIEFSPQGLGFTITPSAQAASLQDTNRCLGDTSVEADAVFDLSGIIKLPATRENPLESMTGQLHLSSTNGRIITTSVLVKIVSYLNASRLMGDRGSDVSRMGLSYRTADAQAQIGEGKLQITEVVMDGDTMKISGQGSFDLSDATADITVLVAPLRTVDRLVDRLPGIGYLTGGSLISIPFHLTGPLNDLKVRPLPPAAVGRGLLNIMERTLQAPVRVVQGAAGLVSEETTGADPSKQTPAQKSP
jgi:hypothetical protein